MKVSVVTDAFVLGATGFALGNALYQLVAFVVLMWLLKKFAWGPLVRVMQKREEHVAHEIDTAEQARKEAEELLLEHKQMVKEAQQEAQTFIENAKKQGEIQKEEIIEQAKKEAQRLKEAAKLEIQQERENAVQALREQVASLSVMIASKVIEKELNEKDQEALIQEYIKKAGEE